MRDVTRRATNRAPEFERDPYYLRYRGSRFVMSGGSTQEMPSFSARSIVYDAACGR